MLLYLDGDDVGNVLEMLLLDGKLVESAAHSRSVTRAVEALTTELSRSMGARILFAAGDEVLAEVDGGLNHQILDDIRDAFHQATGCTISVGVGHSPFEATVNLRRAKLLGKNRVVGERSPQGGS